MNLTSQTCDLCQKQIAYGEGYVSINYHIENMEKDLITMHDTVSVISADQIFTMCGKCGNKANANAVQKVLEITLQSKTPEFN